MPTAYCQPEDVMSVLSEQGTDWAVDDNLSGSPDGVESDFVYHAIERAQVRINQYIARFYDLTTVPGNTWIKWCCAVFAAVQLMRRKGNDCPDGLILQANEYEEFLKLVLTNRATIPEDGSGNLSLLNQNAGLTMSNMTVDHRYGANKLRFVPGNSVGKLASKLPRHADRNQFPY